MLKAKRQPCDDVRGVGQHRSRVVVCDDRALDELWMKHGERGAWMQEPAEMPKADHLALMDFLVVLLGLTDRKLIILFSRLRGMSFIEIGMYKLRGATAQAAENEFAEIMRDHPELLRAFPERMHKGEGKHHG